MKRLLPIIVFLSILNTTAFAQNERLPDLAEKQQQLIEDYLQGLDEGGDFDFNTLFEALETFQKRPLNLNTADQDELESLLLLDDIQINNFLTYRNSAGKLISIYELQAIPSFDLATINRILPFVKVSGEIDDIQLSLKQMLLEGSNEVYIRWGRLLETQRGFEPSASDSTSTPFEGDQNKLYVRYKKRYSNKLHFGITAEKDEGEAFFKGSNKTGFDFYSAHIFLSKVNKNIRAVALGDYTASFGQGLILYSGFGRGKSSQVMSIKRSNQTLRHYSSVDENRFLRGAGTTVAFGKNLEFTAFYSNMTRDANITFQDTLDNEEIVREASSLLTSGKHRSALEIEDEDAIRLATTGGSLKYKGSNWHVALNGMYNQFDSDFSRLLRPYSQFSFNSGQLLNLSIDYSFIYKNYNFFGETAWSDNGGKATTNGLLVSLDRRTNLAVLYRNFGRDFQAIGGAPVAESSVPQNEVGLYVGLEYKLNNNWLFTGYFDSYSHPWLRFRADAPSKGFDYRARLTYKIKRKLELYFEWRDEIKQVNSPVNISKTDYLIENRLFQARLHLSYKPNKTITLRSRIDSGFFKRGLEGEGNLNGIVVYQDIIYKSIQSPWSFMTRFALFDTDSYAIRYYAYENDLLYTFSIPAYYNKGTRFYVVARYKGIRNMTLEARFAQTYWIDQDSFSSGNEEVDGQTRTDIRAQIKYTF